MQHFHVVYSVVVGGNWEVGLWPPVFTTSAIQLLHALCVNFGIAMHACTNLKYQYAIDVSIYCLLCHTVCGTVEEVLWRVNL